jgi:type IV pilus assembly protein PilC
MMRAGLPVLDTMNLITDQIDHKGMKIVIETILNDVETGIPLSECFGKHPHVFDNIYINLLRAGETSGKLDVFLAKLVEGIEKEQKIRTSIKGAMTYPTILLIVAIAVIAVMMIFVVPVFQQMFEGVAGGLPVATRIVITISEFFRDPLGGGVLAGAIVASIVGLKLMMKRSYKFRRLFHGFVLKLPLFGELVQKSSLAKLSMVQGNLSAAGVPVLEALDICSTAVSNVVIQEATNDVRRGVFSGEPLSDLFKKSPKIFPSTFYSMVSVGEQTGNMEEMFESISRYYEEEMDATIERLTSMLEPVMIVFLGVTIGFILVAMYTPMFQVGQTL